MRGYHVARKAGWDCHGLPVELAVEKELGFSGKKDIEAYGIAEFNAKCRESVTRHTDAFSDLTTRMGYWVDLDDAYRTMNPEYVDSVWWSLKEIFNKGLLVQDHRVAPWCPRCGTGLSDHELAQGYETVVDPSVYVRFPLTSGPLAGQASILVWTTTPWTLVSNTAVAAHPDVTYVVATNGEEKLVVAEPLVEKALGEGWETTGESFTGAEMERWKYQRPFELVEFPSVSEGTNGHSPAEAHYVVNADYVTTEDGTGLVHQSPAFGEEDLKVCRSYGLPVVNPVLPDGTFSPEVPLVGGVFFKKADEQLTEDLQNRGLLFKHIPYEHSLPALLALPHGAALLRAAVLVHPHHGHQGPSPSGEREDQLVPGDRQERPLRRLAAEQHRLGAVPQPLLGHPAADLALRGEPPHLRRLARGALAADRHGPVVPRPAPPVHRRRHVHVHP